GHWRCGSSGRSMPSQGSIAAKLMDSHLAKFGGTDMSPSLSARRAVFVQSRWGRWLMPVALGIFVGVATAAGTCWAQAASPSGKKVALLIGVNKYANRGFRDLEFAERDVGELANVLEPVGYEVHVLTSTAAGGKRATLANIHESIEAVLNGRTKKDLVLVAFAGHGLQIEIAGPDGKLQAESFFCPADAEQGNPKT